MIQCVARSLYDSWSSTVLRRSSCGCVGAIWDGIGR